MKKIILSVGTLSLGLLLAACGQNPIQTSSQTPEQSTQVENNQTTDVVNATKDTDDIDDTDDSTPASTNQTSQQKPSVSVTEAIEIFQKEFPDTDITSIDLDTSFGNFFYKIEGVNDLKEYEIKVDAATKGIREREEDDLDADEKNGVKRQEEKLDLSKLLTVDEVTKIAIEQTQGGQATDWDLDREGAVTYWEVDVENGKQEATVKIHAQTGEVLEVELDD